MSQDLPVIRVGPELREAAASRLVSSKPGPDRGAGRRFVANAGAVGIDLSFMWATALDPSVPDRVAQACLAVVGAGRTATLFVSATPSLPGRAGQQRAGQDHLERVAMINAACAAVARPSPQSGRGARLAQSLLDPAEGAAITAFVAAGFTRLGDLAYLRRPVPRPGEIREPALPASVTMAPMTRYGPAEGDELLMRALARSYIQTLDCPELAGLRELPDVIESHRAVGRYDPSLWWLVLQDGQPEGCMLLTRCPESRSVELVYLGLGPELRGRGLGTALLTIGISRIAGLGATLTCAVDTRNTPAQRLYRTAGFEHFATRVPVIRPLSG